MPARSRESHKEIAFAVERGIGNGMKVVGDGDRNLNGMGVTDVGAAVRIHYHRPRRRALGNASHQEIVRTDEHRALDVAKEHAGAAQLRRTQALSHDANLASRQNEARRHRLDVRLAVDVLLPQQAVGDAHEFVRREPGYLMNDYFVRSPKYNRRCMIASA